MEAADPSPEKYLELGDRHAERGELDLAIRYYNLALKKDIDDAAANLRLAEAYQLKAQTGGEVFYTLAMQPLRRVLKTDPLNEAANDKLMLLAFKTRTLDALTREYSEKARAEPASPLYAKYLKYAYAMSLLDSESKIRSLEYTPAIYIKFFFDLFILPVGAMTILISNLGVKFKPFFVLGLTMFLFYCLYRTTLYMLMHRR